MVGKASEFIKEHEQIERELIELETIMNSEVINYPNLFHVVKKIKSFWDEHEVKEELYFNELHKKGFTIPIKKIVFEHGRLKRDMDNIISSVRTGSEFNVKESLKRDGIDLIKKIREHIANEDWIFYALPKRLQ